MSQPFADILENTLYDLLEAARSEINESNESVKSALTAVEEASARIKDAANISDEAMALFDEYSGALSALSDEQQKHLYIRGATDCVEILRKLGVIR